MKVKLQSYFIDLSEEAILCTRKSAYVNTMVKSLRWTEIDREILVEKIGEVYDLVRGK